MQKSKLVLLIVTFFMFAVPKIVLADNAGSFISQLLHNLTHAHHAFGGLLFIAVIVLAFKLKKYILKPIRTKSK